MEKFVPLNIKSGYSFLNSGLTIDKIKSAIKKNDYLGAGISDLNVLYAAPMFAKEMKAINKLSIIGMEVNINDESVTIYAIDEEGYSSLSKISTYLAKGEFDFTLLKDHHNGLVAILDTNSDTFKEETKVSFTNDLALKIKKISDLFFELYLGIEITNKEEYEKAKLIREFAKNHAYDCVAFPKIKYEKEEDAIVMDIVTAIKNEDHITEKKKKGPSYFRTNEDYNKFYLKEEIINTNKIVQMNKLDFFKKRGELLHYPVEDAKAYLKQLAVSGLEKKHINDEKHIQRLEYELDVINRMGYADYFLIVQDYVNYAKNHDILVGPGRGSGAGSLVSYALNITEIDPLEYNLQFERFLNEARKTMPDIDTDFMDIKREEVLQYMRERWGNDRVASIITFTTIAAKQSLRDIGRIYNYPTKHIDLLSKAIGNSKESLRDNYRHNSAFRELVDSDQYFLEIVSLGSKIEGLIRQNSLHASGVILNNTSFDDCMPMIFDLNDHYISQYEMHSVEEQGFLKMDFLAIRNLTTISYCVDLINLNHKEHPIDKLNIPFKDLEAIKLLASGMTTGIFQLESAGMKAAIKTLKPKVFEDIVLLLALFRPGPMDNIKDYALRASGKKKITYLDPRLKEVLEETKGVLVYQEQVNKIAQVVAGFSPNEADVFRRAVSKKEVNLLKQQEKSFIDGAVKNHYSVEVSKTLFNDILKFANYGFNKSHAVVYAVTACRMAYLKQYYPLEFYAAILQIGCDTSSNKFNEYISELKKRNYSILSPSINRSSKVFEIEREGLLFPLSSIKGINRLFVDKVIEEREKEGKFKDFFDFVLRMFPYHISDKQIHALISAGAFDEFNYSRTSLNNMTLNALQFAELNYSDNGQIALSRDLIPAPEIPQVKDDPLERINLEFEALGVLLSDNPLKYKKDLLKKHNAVSISDIDASLQEIISEKDNENSFYYNKNELFVNGTIGGMIRSIKEIKVRKNNTKMAFVKLFDETGDLEVVIFPRVYDQVYTLLSDNNLIVVKGKYEYRDEKCSFIADEIKLLEE